VGAQLFWNRTGGPGPTMYVWAHNISLRPIRFMGPPLLKSDIQSTNVDWSSGGVLTLSAEGSMAGTGIVWSSMPLSQDGDHGTVQGVLRAFDANDLKPNSGIQRSINPDSRGCGQ